MPDKVQVPFDVLLKPTLDTMTNMGLLLVTQAKTGRPNAMTIGWASIGSIWRRPIFQVMVRPSRHTFALLADNPEFTVNVMPQTMRAAMDLCGSTSGRAKDKFHEAKLTAIPGSEIKVPLIAESLIAYECRVVMTNDVSPATLDVDIRNSAYASGDFHRVFYGHIVSVHADPSLIHTPK